MTIEVIDPEAEIEEAKIRLAAAIIDDVYAKLPENPKVYRFGKALKNQRKRERRARRGKR